MGGFEPPKPLPSLATPLVTVHHQGPVYLYQLYSIRMAAVTFSVALA